MPFSQSNAALLSRLILKLARDTGWGYTRILGELRKLGILSISRNTVKLFRAGSRLPDRRWCFAHDEISV